MGGSRLLTTVAVAGALAMAATGGTLAAAQASADRGADIFDGNCGDCHATTADAKTRKGPTLFGIVGRRAGQVPGFDYSEANRTAQVVFDEATLDHYVAAPLDVIPGSRMNRFPGLDQPQERRDLIEFLKTLR